MSRRRQRVPTLPFDEQQLCRDFGKLVQARRDAYGWSQDELSLHAGCSKNTIWRLETGRGWPEMVAFLRLCYALGLTRIPRPQDGPSPMQDAHELIDSLPPSQVAALVRFVKEAWLPPGKITLIDPYTSSLHCGETVS